MTWDESRNEVVDSAVAIENDKTRVSVELARYDGGAVKIQLKREARTKEGWKFLKLGRLTVEEFTEVCPAGMGLLEKHGLLDIGNAVEKARGGE